MSQPQQRFSFVLLLMISTGLVAYAAVGLYARYWQDDYCMGALVREHGWLGAQRAMFQNWTGKVSSTAALATVLLVGPPVAPVLPTVVLLALWAALLWAASGLAVAMGQYITWKGAAVISLVGLFITLDRLPDYIQALYWQTTLLNYVAPLIALTVAVGVAARWPSMRRPRLGLLVVAVLSFISASSLEIVMAVQASALGVAMVCLAVRAEPSQRRRWLPVLAAGLIGSIAALAVMLAAPGIAVRWAAMPPRASVGAIVASTTMHAARHVAWWFLMPPFTAVLSVAAGIVVGRTILPIHVARPRLVAASLVLATLGLVWVSVFPAVWVYGLDAIEPIAKGDQPGRRP